MYLSKSSIIEILSENHMDMSVIDRIYVSSEYGKRKSTGELYTLICKDLPCEPNQILHIGDNWNADYVKAQKSGIQAVFYPLISEGKYRYPYLEYEREHYGDVGREIYSVRLLAAENKLKGEEREWFEIGAMVLGPLLTYASDWVLDLAEEYRIRNIYPMMREGYFLTKMLKRAAQHRNWRGNITPMYISRKALYPALLAVLKRKDIDYLLSTREMTVGGVLRTLNMEGTQPRLSGYEQTPLNDAKDIMLGEKSVYQVLEEHLAEKTIIRDIRERNEHADELLWGYLKSLRMDCEDFITFDVGWRGNAQNAIERIRKKRGASSRGVHLLITGKKEILKERNLEDAADIRGYCANFGENFQTVSNIMIPIFEMMMLCREGTTTEYTMTEEGVAPVCKNIRYGEEQLKEMEMVQAGILSFQNTLYSVCSMKGKKIHENGAGLLKIAARLTALPLKREAELIGKMQYDQNFGIDKKWQIINPESLNTYKELGYNRFVHQKFAREDEWYQGMDVCIDGLVHYKRAMFHRRNGISYQCAMYVERICQRHDAFVLVGAGKLIKEILLYLNMIHESGKVEYIADNNAERQNRKILGYPVYSLAAESKSRCFVITASQKKSICQLTNQLYEMKGTDIQIENFYD